MVLRFNERSPSYKLYIDDAITTASVPYLKPPLDLVIFQHGRLKLTATDLDGEGFDLENDNDNTVYDFCN